MKPSYIKYILSLTVVTLLMIACDFTPKNEQIPNPVAFDTIHLVKTYHLDNDSTKPYCSVKMEFIHPTKASNAELLAKLQSELNYAFMEDGTYEMQTPINAVDSFVFNYIENYKEEAKANFSGWQTSGRGIEYYSFYKIMESNIVYNKANILSYQVKTVDYKGGNLPYVSYNNVVLNLENGEVVREKDIFADDYKKALNTLIKQKLLATYKLESIDQLRDIGYYDVEDISPNNNFSVDEHGITYIFNERNIAAPSVGATRLFFSYKELKEYMKKENPLQILIDN